MGQRILDAADLNETLEGGAFTCLGGYPKFWIAQDGEALSYDAVIAEKDLILAAIKDGGDPQWNVVFCDLNYEDTGLVCAHTNEPIPSAYGDD
tara:strand:- start:342 stop:620 length:279 start_codon:yes stop_codon:yes gene_type:complete